MSTTPSDHESDSADSQPRATSAVANETAVAEPTAMSPTGVDSRLHPFTLWLPALDTLVRSIVPMVIGSFFAGPVFVGAFFALFVLLPVFVYHAIRFYTVSFRVANGEIMIRSGLLSRRERRIPYDRVQEVEIHQGVFHRLLRCAKVDISTAGSDAQEAALNVLLKSTAEDLKRAVSQQQSVAPTQDESLVLDDDRELKNASDFAFELDWRTLVLGGLSSKVVATIGGVVGAIAYFKFFVGMGSEWMSRVSDRVEKEVGEQNPMAAIMDPWQPDLPDTGVLGFVFSFWTDETLPKSILLALLGLGVAIAAYALRYYAFRLARSHDLLSTSHGLLTYRQGTLARDRIQALKLEESLLRRWFGMAAVRVDSAGDNTQVDENKNRDVLVPGAKLADAEEIARQAIPGLTSLKPVWNRISPKAIMRGSKKGWLLVTLAMLQTVAAGHWIWLMWIPAFPLIYLFNYKWYQHTGYWSSDDYVLVRKGWVNRSTVCIPTRNIQSVALQQSPFDRRLQLASLSIDIAGQSNTGGGPRIRHLPLDAALSLQKQLANRAAESEFKW